MRDLFRQVEHVAGHAAKHLATTVDLDFTGFDDKGFVFVLVQMRRIVSSRRHDKAHKAKRVAGLLRTDQNSSFLPKRSEHSAVFSIRHIFNFKWNAHFLSSLARKSHALDGATRFRRLLDGLGLN